MLQLFGLLSGLLTTLAFIPYIRDILLLKSKPQRSTWFIYGILGSVAFFSQLAKGASSSLWLPGIETLATLVTFILSINFGVGGFSKKDHIAIFITVIGLIAWYFTKEAAIALFIVIIIDVWGTYLTVEKAYKDPSSETLTAWLLVALGGLFAILAVGSLNIILLAYPFYIFLANAAVVVAMLLGTKRNVRKR